MCDLPVTQPSLIEILGFVAAACVPTASTPQIGGLLRPGAQGVSLGSRSLLRPPGDGMGDRDRQHRRRIGFCHGAHLGVVDPVADRRGRVGAECALALAHGDSRVEWSNHS